MLLLFLNLYAKNPDWIDQSRLAMILARDCGLEYPLPRISAYLQDIGYHKYMAYGNGMMSVFQFLDYREFLRSHFEDKKVVAPWYSFKVMGDGVGLDQSQVYRILHGHLHISPAALPRFQVYLKLNESEARYFAKLVAFGRARKESESRKIFSELLSLRGSRCHTLEGDQYLLYSDWHHPVVRALLGILKTSDNYEQLASSVRPTITPAQARKSVQLLRNLRLVERSDDGTWKLSDKSLSTGSTYQSMLIRQYQAHSFRLAEESIDRHPKEKRDVNVINLAVDEAAFADCITILKESRRQILERVETVEHPDRIFRLAQAFFPVGELPKGAHS